MLGISLHEKYLSFAAVTEDGESKVIDQTGIVEYPFRMTKKELLSGNSVQDLIGIFKDLRNVLEFPQNTSSLSLPPEFVTIRTSAAAAGADEEDLKDFQRWDTSVKIGQDSYGLLKRQQIISSDENGLTAIGVFFFPKILDHILEAADFARLGIRHIDIAPFAAYETVRRNYDTSNYQRFSLIHFQKNHMITLTIYDRERLLNFCRFRLTAGGPVFYTAYDPFLLEIAQLLQEPEYSVKLFERLGPVFAYADTASILEIWEKVDKAYYMELVNPFVNYSIFKKTKVIEHDNEALNDNIFVEVAGTLFRGMENND